LAEGLSLSACARVFGHSRWVSLEASHKLMLVSHIGPRTQANAHALVHKTVSTLAKDCIPAYATNGLKLYSAARTAHHGT